MARTAFEDLRVYRLAEKLADDVWQIVVTWDAFAKDSVGGQLVEAADSIGANIAEGSGRVRTKRIGGSCGLPAGLLTKRNTFCVGLIAES